MKFRICHCGGELRPHAGITAVEIMGVMLTTKDSEFLLCWNQKCNSMVVIRNKEPDEPLYFQGRVPSNKELEPRDSYDEPWRYMEENGWPFIVSGPVDDPIVIYSRQEPKAFGPDRNQMLRIATCVTAFKGCKDPKRAIQALRNLKNMDSDWVEWRDNVIGMLEAPEMNWLIEKE